MQEVFQQSLMDQDVQECPWSFYRKIRDEHPVYVDPKTGFYVITRYEDVVRALRMTDVLSSKVGMQRATSDAVQRVYDEEGYGSMLDTLATNDPPSHTRYRSLVDRAFVAPRVRSMEGYIHEVAHRLIDTFIEDGATDIHRSFSVPLPMTVIADQLGVPRKDMDRFTEWSDATAAVMVDLMASEEEQIAYARSIVEFQHYFVEQIEIRRHDPADDMLSTLIAARVGNERPLDTTELLSVIQHLLVAGNETTTNALSAGIRLLINNPKQAEKLREDRSLYGQAAEEVLRVDSPVQGLFRVALEDVEFSGTKIPQGAVISLRFGCANHDDRRFEDPERFDMGRKNSRRHIAFGQGTHFCIGAMLARSELTIGLQAINERLNNLRLAVPEEELRHVPSLALRGYQALPVAFDKAIA